MTLRLASGARSIPSATTLSRAQGAYLALTGVWPLLHMGSFEAVLGPKVDRWLVRTVAGLLLVDGVVQLRAGSPETIAQARLLGVGTALTLGAVDTIYATRGRISRVYLVDAAVQAACVAAWVLERRRSQVGEGRTDGGAQQPSRIG